MTEKSVLVICGLSREARIASGPGVVTIAGGADSGALERKLDEFRCRDVGAVISFGLAGALDPELKVGDIVLPEVIVGRAKSRIEASGLFRSEWLRRLSAIVSRSGDVIVGVERPVLDPAGKGRLRAETTACAVDMESHIAADYAMRIGVPFGVLRVISDDAGRTLPTAAAVAMRPDGSIDLAGVLASLARQPGQIPALLATARDASVAFRELRRVRGLLGPRFGLHL